MLFLLKKPAFLNFWLAQIFSRLGDAIATTAIIFIIGSNSSDPLIISLVIFAELISTTLFGLFAGLIADRFPKHLIMIYMDIFRIIVTTIIIFNLNSPIILIFLVFLKGIGTTFFYPARTSFIPNVAGEEHVTDAISISQSTYSTVYIIGPIIAGLLLTTTSVLFIFIIDIISYILSIIFILISNSLITTKQTTELNQKIKTTNESLWFALSSGIKTVYRIPTLFFLLIILFPFMFIAGIFDTTYTSILLQIFQVSALDYGNLESIEGLGAIIGAIIGPFLLKKLNPSLLLICTIIAFGILMGCVTPLNLIHRSNLAPIYIWSLIIGIVNSLLNIPINTLFLSITPIPFRGRGISILQTLSTLGIILGLLLGGIAARYFNPIFFTTIAGLTIIIFAIMICFSKKFKELYKISSTPLPLDSNIKSEQEFNA
ncbi:MFS transporter [Bacillus fungorum]|uniref:MFS transporter n=1 Tax=Bacillus fungorum TaxID=2039284 RepID=A0A2G6Q9P9_9BACI|nr:MFS transporter [Bacillus fungorum]PIE93572.1 MFS transporter [Bacillus fungorum]